MVRKIIKEPKYEKPSLKVVYFADQTSPQELFKL
jgi:hypothetical protein